VSPTGDKIPGALFVAASSLSARGEMSPKGNTLPDITQRAALVGALGCVVLRSIRRTARQLIKEGANRITSRGNDWINSYERAAGR
jgi:hypothetical protein